MTDPLTQLRDVVECVIGGATRWTEHLLEKAKMAEAALDRLEGRILPLLPEGWRLCALRERARGEEDKFFCSLISQDGEKREGYGPTPRAACLDAIAKIKAT